MEQLELWSAANQLRVADELVSHAALTDVYVDAARAARTRVAYTSDWRSFERWCVEQGERSLPTSSSTLARYLAHLAHSGRKGSTIRRARIAIGVLHREQGFARPDLAACIRSLEQDIGQTQAAKEEGATPLRRAELEQMVSTLGQSTRDDRDRALLLVGFAGAFRASELVGLDVSDVRVDQDGLRLEVRCSKEVTHIPRCGTPALCAVRALERWLISLDSPGPLFRPAYGTRISLDRLGPRAVSRAVQRVAERAGLSGDYSSHSLRSGLATSERAQGRSTREIQVLGRWKDLRSLERYSHATCA